MPDKILKSPQRGSPANKTRRTRYKEMLIENGVSPDIASKLAKESKYARMNYRGVPNRITALDLQTMRDEARTLAGKHQSAMPVEKPERVFSSDERRANIKRLGSVLGGGGGGGMMPDTEKVPGKRPLKMRGGGLARRHSNGKTKAVKRK